MPPQQDGIIFGTIEIFIKNQTMKKSNSEKQKISVICPVFNEEETIPLYYERFQKGLACLNDGY